MNRVSTSPQALTVGLLGILLALSMPTAHAKSAAGALEKMDRDGDGRLSKSEWRKKRVFDRIDSDSDGYLSVREMKVFFGEPTDEVDPSSVPDAKTLSAIRRAKWDDPQDLKDKGLVPTGLRPVWPEGIECRGIDETYAMDYTYKRPREAYHGGIDMPAPFGTPIIAAMDGEVVAVFDGAKTNPRGAEIVLRHTPEESGLPLFIYSRYTHFDTLPTFKPGDRVRMGDVLGTTGNSGLLGCEVKGEMCRGKSRRPAIHYDILYSEKSNFLNTGWVVVPVGGHWMDPNALYRGRMPVDSVSMRNLPEADKAVPIAYKLSSGEIVPPDAKAIWPYHCWRNGEDATPAGNTAASDGNTNVLDTNY